MITNVKIFSRISHDEDIEKRVLSGSIMSHKCARVCVDDLYRRSFVTFRVP